MARFGMSVEGRLGVSVPVLRRIARATGRDHRLALALWQTGIAEARILASMVADPEALTERQMEAWVRDLDSWDVCDQACMNLFEKSRLARRKILEWSVREETFVKRAAFALIACVAWHDRDAPDEEFLAWLPLIARGASDDRNYVKKAVSWALRHIGKRNIRLNAAALRAARALRRLDAKSARWIGADAIRELSAEATRPRIRRAAAPRRPPPARRPRAEPSGASSAASARRRSPRATRTTP
jgi:3-methyladenine DNA glycosylase AlkD